MPTASALEVNHISKTYAAVKAVDDLSFSVEGGEIFGLLGPNGAGKTTTIRMMEILLVSLQPRHLLAGKVLGLGALSLVQYILWIGIGLLSLLVTGQSAGGFLTGLSLSPGQLVWICPLCPGRFLAICRPDGRHRGVGPR